MYEEAVLMAIGIGIIGCGQVMKRFYLPECQEAQGVDFVATCDMDLDKAKNMADLLGAKDVYRDYIKLLNNPRVEAVMICTPNYLHHPMTVAAAKAGKHVLVEKPMAMSLSEADDMIKVSRESCTILMVEQRERFMPIREATRDILCSNVLGHINSVKVRVGHGGPEHWSPTSTWFLSPSEAGGGAMIDLGIHGADLILYSTQKRVKKVFGIIGTLEKNIEVEDYGICIISFDDGTYGMLEASWVMRPGEASLTAHCEKGLLEAVVKGNDSFLRYYQCKSPEERPCIVNVPIPEKSKYGGPILHFIECIRNSCSPSVAGEDGRAALAIVLGTYESSRTGRSVNITNDSTW